ncbi:MAG: hypothetical protein D6830_07055, partial [Ignavibacteria bacterium]
MLNKIANIELNTSGNKPKSKFKRKNFGTVYSTHHLNLKDSLSINPAFRLLNHFGIIIHEFQKQSTALPKLILKIDKFFFELKTSPVDIGQNKNIEYDIWEADIEDRNTFKILLSTKTFLREDFTELEKLNLDSLSFLFS